jgi:MFS family permease
VARPLAAGRRVYASLVRDGRGPVLLAVSFGWFLGLGIRLAAPALVPHVRAEFGIDLATAGLLLSTLWVTYALLQLPGGALGDRIGERAVLAASSALATVGLAACALAASPAGLFAGFVALGAATGAYATTRFTSITDLYPERTATALGVCSAAGNVGTVVVPAAAGAVAVAAGWRLGFAGVAPLFALAAVGLWIAVPARTSGATSALDELSRATLARLVAGVLTPRTLVLTATMLLMSVVYQGFTSFYPTYLATTKGLSRGTAAVVYGAFFAAGIVVQPVAGAVADRVGDEPAAAGAALAAAGALGALVTVDGLGPLVAVSLALAAQLGFWPVAQSAVIGSLPTEMQGTGFGFLRTVYLLVAAAAPTAVGGLADRGRFDEAFLLLGGCALVAAGLALGLALARRD